MKKVDWSKWSSIAEILSAIAIVVTLLYLADQARELRLQTEQNNLLMRSQTRSEISQSIVSMILAAGHSDYLEEISTPEDLATAGSVSAMRFQIIQLASLRIWENIHYQWRNGLYEESEYAAEKRIWEDGLNQASLRTLYRESREYFSQASRSELDSLLAEPC